VLGPKVFRLDWIIVDEVLDCADLPRGSQRDLASINLIDLETFRLSIGPPAKDSFGD
jgi:hypothetical protein